jgi:hypothetical protein
MSIVLSSTTHEDEADQALRTYLGDHTAGAEHAIQLLRALKEEHQATALGDFVTVQLPQVEDDLKILEDLARRFNAEGFQVKELAGWLGDKLTRFKLAPGGSPFNTFEVLEFLSLGILGKRALWRTLIAISSMHPQLQELDLYSLVERAELQHDATETMRLLVAKQVFG